MGTIKADNFYAADGTNPPIFPVNLRVTTPSIVWVTTGNGHGSTNNKIRIFTTTKLSQGTGITYATTAANGGSFTINEKGLYYIHYTDKYSAGSQFNVGISANSNQLTTDIETITESHRLAYNNAATNVFCHISGVYTLAATDVVRAHTNGVQDNADSRTVFMIAQICRVT